MSTRLIPLLILLIVSGCASQIMKNYVGRPLTEPVFDHGPPSTAFDLGDGRRAFIWTKNNSIIFPGSSTTTGSINTAVSGSVFPIGNQLQVNANAHSNIYANTTIMPPTQHSFSCHYALYATRTRTDIEGPAAWNVVGFRKPKFICE